MPLAAAIPLFALIMVTVAAGAYYAVVAARVRRTRRRLPSLRHGVAMAEEVSFWPSLCVVVPAHNEREVVATLTRSLLAQDYPKLRVVFSLDRCTDDTEAILRRELAGSDRAASVRSRDPGGTGGSPTRGEASAIDDRFEILTIAHCPDDWAGKVHAVHHAVTNSRGAADADLLLFTDADTWFDPPALRAAVTLLTNRHLDLLSLLPTLTAARWFERVVQPAAGLELIRRYPLDRLNRVGESSGASGGGGGGGIRFANGQFLLFKRDAYDAIGGHERVKDALLEDLAFAKHISRRKNNRKLGVLLSGGLFHCRMYHDWAEFRRGWKRIYTESAHRSIARLRRDARRIRAIAVGTPLVGLGALVAGAIVWLAARDAPLAIALAAAGGSTLLAYALAIALVLRIQGLPVHLVGAYPVGAWLTGSILREAAADLAQGRKTVWAGREYERKPA